MIIIIIKISISGNRSSNINSSNKVAIVVEVSGIFKTF